MPSAATTSFIVLALVFQLQRSVLPGLYDSLYFISSISSNDTCNQFTANTTDLSINAINFIRLGSFLLPLIGGISADLLLGFLPTVTIGAISNIFSAVFYYLALKNCHTFLYNILSTLFTSLGLGFTRAAVVTLIITSKSGYTTNRQVDAFEVLVSYLTLGDLSSYIIVYAQQSIQVDILSPYAIATSSLILLLQIFCVKYPKQNLTRNQNTFNYRTAFRFCLLSVPFSLSAIVLSIGSTMYTQEVVRANVLDLDHFSSHDREKVVAMVTILYFTGVSSCVIFTILLNKFCSCAVLKSCHRIIYLGMCMPGVLLTSSFVLSAAQVNFRPDLAMAVYGTSIFFLGFSEGFAWPAMMQMIFQLAPHRIATVTVSLFMVIWGFGFAFSAAVLRAGGLGAASASSTAYCIYYSVTAALSVVSVAVYKLCFSVTNQQLLDDLGAAQQVSDEEDRLIQ